MRDPKRIKRITDKLAEIWSATPDLRFFQLLWAYKFLYRMDDGDMYDPFGYEDDKFEEELDEILGKKDEFRWG